MKLVYSFALLLLCYLALPAVAQEPAPKKVGLVLSGGGAKGLAHLGLLQLIDSLQIKVDYITGTSMGGIIGGLYASGYSADSIKKIVLGIEWERILSNKIPLNEIAIEEKDEYENYAIELPLEKGRPKLPSSLIEGQYLSEVLNGFTAHVAHINDFSQLPIPIKIMATDIVNGGLVILDKGSLPLAIRATMAIPAAFSPVYMDGKLLVDGGLERNFPVKEAREMGADYIIGGYTGFRKMSEKEIANPMKLLFQTHAFKAVEDAARQKTMTDVLVDYTQILSEISTSDFGLYREVIRRGEQEARKFLPQLIALKQLVASEEALMPAKPLLKDALPIAKIEVAYEDGLTPMKANERGQIVNRMAKALSHPTRSTARSIAEGIKNIYGTRAYEKVFYSLTPTTTDSAILGIQVKKGTNGHFKVGLYYDADQSAGVLLNYTYRNLRDKRSRLVTTVDLAERFKFRTNYYAFLGNTSSWWLKPSFEFFNLKNTDLTIKSFGFVNNSSDIDYFNSTVRTQLKIGYNINQSSMIEMGPVYEFHDFRKRNSILSDLFLTDSNYVGRSLYRHHSLSWQAKYTLNTLNSKYFPKKGKRLIAQLAYFNYDKLKVFTQNAGDSLSNSFINYLLPPANEWQRDIDLLRFSMHYQYVRPVSKNVVVSTAFFYGINNRITKADTSRTTTFFNQRFYIGGVNDQRDDATIDFTSLKRGELPFENVASTSVGIQYNVKKNLFLTPSVSVAKSLTSINPFKMGDNTATIIGYGIEAGYQSILGPVRLSWSKCNLFNRSRLFFSLGYRF